MIPKDGTSRRDNAVESDTATALRGGPPRSFMRNDADDRHQIPTRRAHALHAASVRSPAVDLLNGIHGRESRRRGNSVSRCRPQQAKLTARQNPPPSRPRPNDTRQ